MRRFDRVTWIVLAGTLCFALYLVSYHPLRAAQVRVPALKQLMVTQAFEPARRVAECESLSGPMQCWARVWGQSTRCRPGLRNLRLALHNYSGVYLPAYEALPASGADVSVDSGPGQFPPID
jgi:hypothetical protein